MHDYQQYIKSLKEQNFCIIGYARKSNGSEKEEVRVNLLHQMCNRLKSRSLVDHIFVSYSCKANDCIHERDQIKQEEIIAKLQADGDTGGKVVSNSRIITSL